MKVMALLLALVDKCWRQPVDGHAQLRGWSDCLKISRSCSQWDACRELWLFEQRSARRLGLDVGNSSASVTGAASATGWLPAGRFVAGDRALDRVQALNSPGARQL